MIMRKNLLTALLFTVLFAITTIAPAEKPPGKNKDNNGNRQEQSDRYQNQDDYYRHGDDKSNQRNEGYDRHSSDRNWNENNGQRTTYFRDQDRYVIHNYYTEQYRHGHCPPGLAKKNNGCRPPGHARKWQIGRQLPRDVIFYDIPPQVTILLEPPPPHHRYVRVASDILLITIGAGMVVDAIMDLNDN